MDLGSVFIITGLLLMTVFFIAHPFYEPPAVKNADRNEMFRLLEKRERILSDIHDLDLDFTLGKIPTEEYPRIRDQLMDQGAEILRQIDQIPNDLNIIPQDEAERSSDVHIDNTADPLYDTMETIIAERRRMKQEKATGFCPRCGSPILKSDVFCWKCGHKIS